MYVEAKQFGTTTKGAVQKAVRQTLATWARLKNRATLREAALVFFCHGNTRLTFRDSVLEYPEGRLLLQVVDIAPESGHHGPRVLEIVPDDLSPESLAGSEES
jgi:hypothetical protein